VAANFNTEMMNQASKTKSLRHELANKEPSVANLGKFDPNDFDMHEDAFLNLLAQSYGVLHEPLHYIVPPDMAPVEFTTNKEQRMYQFPLMGGFFKLDNQAVYHKLKAFLIDSPVGLGLSLMMQPRTEGPPIWHGQRTTMEKENSVITWQLQSQSLRIYIITMSTV
jgi:hypothetical protein